MKAFIIQGPEPLHVYTVMPILYPVRSFSERQRTAAAWSTEGDS